MDPLDAGLGLVGDVEGEQPVLGFTDRKEDRVADNRSLAAHRDGVGESDDPCDFKIGEVARFHSGLGVAEVAMVLLVEAERHNGRRGGELRRRAIGGAAHRGDPVVADGGGFREIIGDVGHVGGGEADALRDHLACDQRVGNVAGRHAGQRGAGRRACGFRIVVAGRAACLVNRFARMRPGRFGGRGGGNLGGGRRGLCRLFGCRRRAGRERDNGYRRSEFAKHSEPSRYSARDLSRGSDAGRDHPPKVTLASIGSVRRITGCRAGAIRLEMRVSGL